MKKLHPPSIILLQFLLILFSISSYAQVGVIKGKIIDQSSGQGIEYASITIFSAQDSSLINGVLSNENGNFIAEAIPQQDIYILAQFLGYEPFQSAVFELGTSKDFGTITLGINTATLSEVEVSGKAITSSYKLDKQVYDAAQFENARGGTATDVLANLPSVNLNSFGELSVRGSTGFLIMINGKPVLTDAAAVLSQLPANSIEDIEIITAPSAKYDPDGTAGIVNIITRKNSSDGFYLLANALLGLPSIEDYDNVNNTPRYGADLTLNYKVGKWDITGALDYRRYDISGRREGYVNTYIEDVLTEFPSDGERSFDEENYSARFSASFHPDNRQTFDAGFYVGKRTKERTADILYLNQQRSRIAQSQFLGTEAYFDLYEQRGTVFPGGDLINQLTYFNENLRVRRGDFLIGSLDYSYRFSKTSALKVSALYERTLLGGPTDNVSLSYPGLDEIFQLQRNDNDNPLDGVRINLDYNKQLGQTNWEAGYQYRYLNHPGDFVYLDRDLDNGVWVENPLFTNSIGLTRVIHSIYNQFSGKLGRLAYNGGLRLEYFDRSVEIERPQNTFLLDQFNLFPSANISYDLSDKWKAKAGYSRRIQRTTTFKMTPFPEREHSETLEQGDAELLPEYIDLVELGLVHNWEDNSVFGTAYYRHIDNVINRVNTVFNDTILNRIYTNVGQAEVFGFEAGTTLYPGKGWRLYLGANVYNYGIKGDLFGDAINTSNTIFSINANTNIKLNPRLSLQLAFNYLSERVTAQGRDSRFYNPSLSLRQSFLDKRLNIMFQWRNIDLGVLDSNEQRITTVRDNFYTTTNYVYEVDILQLSISYQINQVAKNIKLLDSEFGKKEF